MRDRFVSTARLAVSILILAALALTVAAGQRWMP
jgi:hypothetical protein